MISVVSMVRFAGGYFMRRYFPGRFHVRSRTLRLVPVSGTAFRGDQPELIVWRLRIPLYMGKRKFVVCVYVIGIGAVATLKTAILSHKYENIR